MLRRKPNYFIRQVCWLCDDFYAFQETEKTEIAQNDGENISLLFYYASMLIIWLFQCFSRNWENWDGLKRCWEECLTADKQWSTPKLRKTNSRFAAPMFTERQDGRNRHFHGRRNESFVFSSCCWEPGR